MRAFERLKSLLADEGGNALVVSAASLPLLLGAAGLAVDSIQLALQKREMQRAADSASIAGAYALAQSKDAARAVDKDLDENAFPLLTQPETVTVGARLGFNQTVRVQLTASHKLPFMSLFTKSNTTVTADATAALIQSGNFCMLSLYKGTEAGIDVNGNGNLNLGCGMATNSRAAQAVTAGGSSSVTASPIMAVGGLDGTSNNFVSPTTLQPNSAEQLDPFANVPNPPAPSPCLPGGELSGATTFSGGTASTNAGTIYCYTSMSVKPSETVNLPANSTIVIYGGNADIKGNVNGTGVTIALTGPNGAAGTLDMNSQAVLNMTAPTTGDYKNMLFYRDRRASNTLMKLNGGSGGNLTGALYFPSNDIEFTGNSDFQVNCLMMVGQRLIFRGTTSITNSCTANGASSGFQLTYVRLVG